MRITQMTSRAVAALSPAPKSAGEDTGATADAVAVLLILTKKRAGVLAEIT
jgi:hypothetical protein